MLACCWLGRCVVYLQLQVVVALADDIDLSLRGESQRHRRHDALLCVKLEAWVLALAPYIHQVVGLCRVAPQEQGHFGLIDAAVLGAELDFDQTPCILQPNTMSHPLGMASRKALYRKALCSHASERESSHWQ